MRADRLLSILLYLQNRGRVTARELAEKLEVSERTIHRDMEALSAAGIPVYAVRGPAGRWTLAEGYRTRLTGMKKEEFVSLLVAEPSRLLRDLGFRDAFETASEKLLAASPAEIRRDVEDVLQRLHVDESGWHPSNESFGHLPAIREAVRENRKLRIRYLKDREVAERVVHPLGLVAKRGTWYMVADADGDIRTFRISRLSEVCMLDETFERPAGFDLAEYWERSVRQFKERLPRYPARVKVCETLLPRFLRERYVNVLRTRPLHDGWVEADVEFNTLESACEMLLGFGPLAEAIEPAELRNKILADAKAVVALYDRTDESGCPDAVLGSLSECGAGGDDR